MYKQYQYATRNSEKDKIITYNLCTKDSVLQYWKVNSFTYRHKTSGKMPTDGFSIL